MSETDEVRQMRRLKFLNKHSNKQAASKTNNSEPISKDLFKYSNQTEEPNKITSSTHNSESLFRNEESKDPFYSKKDETSNPNLTGSITTEETSTGTPVNYKEIFNNQIYFDKVKGRLNVVRFLIFILVGAFHYYFSGRTDNNVQILFSIIIVLETSIVLLMIKLNQDKKKSILDKISSQQEDEHNQGNKTLSLLNKVFSIMGLFTPLFSDVATVFFVNFALVFYHSLLN